MPLFRRWFYHFIFAQWFSFKISSESGCPCDPSKKGHCCAQLEDELSLSFLRRVLSMAVQFLGRPWPNRLGWWDLINPSGDTNWFRGRVISDGAQKNMMSWWLGLARNEVSTIDQGISRKEYVIKFHLFPFISSTGGVDHRTTSSIDVLFQKKAASAAPSLQLRVFTALPPRSLGATVCSLRTHKNGVFPPESLYFYRFFGGICRI